MMLATVFYIYWDSTVNAWHTVSQDSFLWFKPTDETLNFYSLSF